MAHTGNPDTYAMLLYKARPDTRPPTDYSKDMVLFSPPASDPPVNPANAQAFKIMEMALTGKYCKRVREISLAVRDPDEPASKKPRLAGSFTSILNTMEAESHERFGQAYAVSAHTSLHGSRLHQTDRSSHLQLFDPRQAIGGWTMSPQNPLTNPGSMFNYREAGELEPEHMGVRNYTFVDVEEAEDLMDVKGDSSVTKDDAFDVTEYDDKMDIF